MNHEKHLHPMTILVNYVTVIKNYFFLIMIFFVFRMGDEALWVQIGRWGVVALLAYNFVLIPFKWLKTNYVLTYDGITIKEGIFNRQERHVAFKRVQNIQKNKPFYLNLFRLVKVRLETGAEGDHSDIELAAIKGAEADWIESLLDEVKKEKLHPKARIAPGTSEQIEAIEETEQRRITHFVSSRKDILKASLLSFSYLAFIPIIGAIVSNAGDFINFEMLEKRVWDAVRDGWAIMSLAIILFLLLVIAIGLVSTYLRYGKYEISSDETRIYLKSGVLSERHFSIRKDQVQAVKINRSPLKRILHIAEVELVTAGSLDTEMEGTNTLYPFLPVDRAYSLIEELLPAFNVKRDEDMEVLPGRSLIARLLRVPWLFLIALAGLLIFKPDLWYLSILLLLCTILSRLLDYQFTRFMIDHDFIQLQSGGFHNSLTVMNHKKVIELEVKQSIVKRWFGLATLQATSRGKPINVEEMRDIPFNWSIDSYLWYEKKGEH